MAWDIRSEQRGGERQGSSVLEMSPLEKRKSIRRAATKETTWVLKKTLLPLPKDAKLPFTATQRAEGGLLNGGAAREK